MSKIMFHIQRTIAPVITLFYNLHFKIFAIKLKLLVWYFNGVENIPAKYLKNSIIATPEFHTCIKICGELQHINSMFGRAATQGTAAKLVGGYIFGTLEDYDQDQAIGKILSRVPRRKEIYDLMIKMGDITPTQIAFHLPEDSVKKKEFMTWLVDEGGQ
jgi:hypothetical protein